MTANPVLAPAARVGYRNRVSGLRKDRRGLMHRGRMAKGRMVGGAVALALGAGLAGCGVLVHYGVTAEYADVTDSTLEATLLAFTPAGVGGIALGLVGVVALVAFVVSPRRGMRVAALLLPVALVLGMFAVTPAALEEKLRVQYHPTPQCASVEGLTQRGPGVRAERASQRVFESIDHVGLFGGGGASGVGGCDRTFVVVEDLDVLEHYRAALPRAGWRIVEDGEAHLRAERHRMAFEVAVCGEGGVVWAGGRQSGGGARCRDDGLDTVES